jgi:hypothetical protein
MQWQSKPLHHFTVKPDTPVVPKYHTSKLYTKIRLRFHGFIDLQRVKACIFPLVSFQ